MAVEPEHEVLLYVEDQKSVQGPMVDMLRKAGFDLLVADNGVQALKCIADEKGHIDCVLTHVRLGRGPTGWNVARRARLRTSTMPVVYTSSSSKAEWMVYGVPLSELVTKPFRPSQVIQALSSVTHRASAAIPHALRRQSSPAAAVNLTIANVGIVPVPKAVV